MSGEGTLKTVILCEDSVRWSAVLQFLSRHLFALLPTLPHSSDSLSAFTSAASIHLRDHRLQFPRHLHPSLSRSLSFGGNSSQRAPRKKIEREGRAALMRFGKGRALHALLAASLVGGGALAQSDECTISSAAGFDFEVGLCMPFARNASAVCAPSSR